MGKNIIYSKNVNLILKTSNHQTFVDLFVELNTLMFPLNHTQTSFAMVIFLDKLNCTKQSKINLKVTKVEASNISGKERLRIEQLNGYQYNTS